MDKETQRNMLLAIVLSMLIMIVWMHFFAPETPERQRPEAPVSEDAAVEMPEEVSDGPAREPLEETHPPERLTEARDIVVETRHMVATFTTYGGRLTSLRLPEYQSKRGGEVELVPTGEGMLWPLALKFDDPDFGTRTENFLYEHVLHKPSGAELQDAVAALRECSERVAVGSSSEQMRRELSRCLSGKSIDETLLSALVGIAGKAVSANADPQAIRQLAEKLSASQILLFHRQMTPRLKLLKAFVFDQEKYCFDMYTVFRNISDTPLALGDGQPNYSINWAPGMESSESEVKHDELVGVHLVQRDFGQKAVRKLKEAREFPSELTWVGLKRKYFFVALEPDDGLVQASMRPLGEKEERVRISLAMGPKHLESGEAEADHLRLSAGPMLKEVLESLGPGFDQIINFGFFDLFGKLLLGGLLWFNKYVQNYGLAIILLTIVVRLGLFPLNQKSYKSMREMQALQPKVNELREKYKKNPQEMNKKMMELYRTHKVNPMGGCLPIAFQMPIFIALFQALRYAVELRGARFLWIKDLSEADRLFTLTVPFQFPINLLPLLVIVAMLLQQKMTPMAGGQSEAQQKMMQYMPIFFGFLFYSMPSGLTVYFLVSTVLGLVQQYFVQKAA